MVSAQDGNPAVGPAKAYRGREVWLRLVVRGTKARFDNTGRFDHVAFAATDFEGVCAHLDSKKIEYRHQVIPRTGGRQIFLYDPDGVGVELNFDPEEVKKAGAAA